MTGNQKTIHLQFVGEHPAVKASELKPGDVTVWNGGSKEKIINIQPSKTGKTLQAEIEYENFQGKKVKTTRRLNSNTLVGIEKSKNSTQTTSKTPAQGKSATSFAVKCGKTTKTFATKKEAKEYASAQSKGKTVNITESTKKPTHKIVKFTAKR